MGDLGAMHNECSLLVNTMPHVVKKLEIEKTVY